MVTRTPKEFPRPNANTTPRPQTAFIVWPFSKKTAHREAKETTFKREIEQSITRNPVQFNSFEELRNHVYAALVHYLSVKGVLADGPYDSVINPLASINDLDKEKISTQS